MEILKTELNIGLETTVRILQVSDSHMSACDERDSAKALEKSAKKTRGFLDLSGGIKQEDNFLEALKLSEDCDALVFTGDVIDCPSDANIEFLESTLEGRKYLYTFGNHDYYTYDSDCGKAEDRDSFLDQFLRFIPGDPTMDSMEVGGLNLVALDDSLAQFSEMQLAFLKAELEKGLPTLLFLHLPFYSDSFADESWKWWESVMSVGAPLEVLEKYGETDPKMKASETTKAVMKLIEESSCVKAIFASHLHFKDETEVLGKPQFINEPCFMGSVREIIVK